MDSADLIPTLMLVTLGAVALVGVLFAVKFFSKKSNREAGERAVTGDSDSFERPADDPRR
jgi:hypothetical protein